MPAHQNVNEKNETRQNLFSGACECPLFSLSFTCIFGWTQAMWDTFSFLAGRHLISLQWKCGHQFPNIKQRNIWRCWLTILADAMSSTNFDTLSRCRIPAQCNASFKTFVRLKGAKSTASSLLAANFHCYFRGNFIDFKNQLPHQ